ncbi:uroporphyrinogen decarboxylase family protein [Dethiosulfovibrio sp. F2B]|uniref:uroporphyrinogen decarboxylase family protein n=1 Tax=Dethiosulfovibrio faecalis TaxID=2720018 RepID=UPI001F33A5B1|nr:uroporphyrinogen decarboxylase family protein [Dethiosulfovibrio faecalis]MCF4152352.1 uroporphyrinogen decarboxylase family protein [Dethiosulfovibrio faecalis]
MPQFKDLMTPLERAKAMSTGQPVDRLQCNPNLSNGIARISGCRISEFNHDPRALADAVIATHRRFGGDGAKVFTDLFTVAEAMGAKIKFPDDDTADLLEPAIDDVSRIDELEPIDPEKACRIPVHLKAMEMVVDEISSEVPCTALVVGPFTTAFFLIGVEKMTRLMVRDPQSVDRLCQVSLESTLRYVDAAASRGMGISIAEPLSSCTVVSPKHFRRYAAPAVGKLLNHIKDKGMGTSMHICGKTDGIWEDLADMGLNALSIDNVVPLPDCVSKVGDRMKIMGKVDPSSVMFAGTREEVRKACLSDIRDAYRSPKGFALMSGCGLPVETPIRNIDAMMDATRELGWPITEEKQEKALAIDRYDD